MKLTIERIQKMICGQFGHEYRLYPISLASSDIANVRICKVCGHVLK